MGSLYSEHRTWLHGLRAGFKLAVLVLFGTLSFYTDSVLWLGTGAVLCGLVYLSLGQAALAARGMLVSVVVACALVLGFHAWMGQTIWGVVSTLRLVSAALLGVALTVTTPPAQLLAVLEWLLLPVQRLGFPTHRIALQLGLMLRFVEHFFVLWRRLDDAHRVRTGRAGGVRLLAPLTIQLLLSARQVADALDARLGE